MLMHILIGAMAVMPAPPPQQQTDTVVPVRADARVDVQNFAGSISVKTWDKPQVRIVAAHSRRDRVIISGSEASIRVRSDGRNGPSFTVDYELTVPTGASLKLSGTYTDISVQGTKGSISAETVQGEVRVTGGTDLISLSSVEGPVTVDKARGKITIKAVNKEVRMTDCAGQITIDAVNGYIDMQGMESDDIDASTVNGNIMYQGTIKDKGIYHFGTHNGRITVTIPEKTNATISAVTYQGSFGSDLGSALTQQEPGANRRRKTYQIGNGSAKIDLESFQGAIRLRRAGSDSRED